MRCVTITVSEIDASHHSDSCFHYLTLVSSTPYLSQTPVYISETGNVLYGISLSVYHSLVKNGIESCTAIVVPGEYDEKFDLYMSNISSNVTLLYHKVKKNYDQASDVSECEFDCNQLDLMYLTDLDDVSLDIREIQEEIVKIKKQFNVTIVLKTLEQNFRVQKFFKTNVNEISYNNFYRVANNVVNPFDDDFVTINERFYRSHVYPDFIIKCDSIDQMNKVLDFFKINKDKIKTTRVNFAKLEKIIP